MKLLKMVVNIVLNISVESIPILCMMAIFYWLLASGGLVSILFFKDHRFFVASMLFITISVFLFTIPIIGLFTERFLIVLIYVGWLMAALGIIAMSFVAGDERFFIVSAFIFITSLVLGSVPFILRIIFLVVLSVVSKQKNESHAKGSSFTKTSKVSRSS